MYRADIPPILPMVRALWLAVACTVWAGIAHAGMDDPLAQRLTPDVLDYAFPGAEDLGENLDGDVPAVEVLIDETVAGYIVSTFDTVPSAGFAGEPFDIVVGLDLRGRVRGLVLLEHHEPIIGPSMIRAELVQAFLDQLENFAVVRSLRSKRRKVDAVSGATVSSKLMLSASVSAGRKIAQATGIVPATSATALAPDVDTAVRQGWHQMVANGDIAALELTNADVAAAFDNTAGTLRLGAPDDMFVTIYLTMATPRAIGGNLFGDRWQNFMLSQTEAGDQVIVIAAHGEYDAFGSTGTFSNQFDLIRIVQGDKTIALSRDDKLAHTAIRLRDAPRPMEHALFKVGPKQGFDPFQPWSLKLLVTPGAVGLARDAAPAVFERRYRIPAAYVVGNEFALEDAGFKTPNYVMFGLLRESLLTDWQREWVARAGDIGILAVMLAVLTLVLVFQNTISQSRRLHTTVRLVFLVAMLGWLGWLKDAQLTSINIIAYFQAFFEDLDPALFLLDPLIFILSVYVGVTLLLWGRGVFCGWLCPFGALQELLNKFARLVRMPQVQIGEALQERLWAVKYVVVAVVFGLAFFSMDAAIKAAEVEPFKTAIIVPFDRSWPYLAYVGVLLVIGLSIERFFCRFLCPLGGALSLLGRARLLHWLRRRPQCGNPCRICRHSCPVGAIRENGVIDMNECFQCLDCQVDYLDTHVCPPLVAAHKRAARPRATPGPVVA